MTTHAPCPACSRRVKIIARPDQPHAHLAQHGPALGIICSGSGKPVEKPRKP